MGNSLITPLVRNRNVTAKIYLFQNDVPEHCVTNSKQYFKTILPYEESLPTFDIQ